MIGVSYREPTNSAGSVLPAATITGAVYHTAKGSVVVTHGKPNGGTTTTTLYGQEGVDLYNALVAIKAGTYTSTT